MPITIRLRRLGPIAALESVIGEVVDVSGVSMLEGTFRLVVGATGSDPVEFSPSGRQAVVVPDGPDFLLVRAARVRFLFAAPVRIGVTPWLEYAEATLSQPDRPGAMAVLALGALRASLMKGGSVPESRLAFPTKNGAAEVSLISPSHPENPNEVGFFLVPFEGGHAVTLGSVSDRINIDHAVAADVVVQNDCAVFFRLEQRGRGMLVVDGTMSASGSTVRAVTNSGLAMAANPDAPDWQRLRLRVDRLHASDGWLRVARFAPREVWLGHVLDLNTTPVTSATGILASSARLGWELSLPSFDGGEQTRARLTYQDPNVASGGQPTIAERLYGVRVTGLGSRSGARPVLAASYAVFELGSTGGIERFDLKAGGMLPAGDGAAPSSLVPALDPRNSNGARVLDVPAAGEMSVRCVAPAKPAKDSPLLLDTAQTIGFVISNPLLVSAPVGISSGGNNGYARWTLALPAHTPKQIGFALGSDRLQPENPDKWLTSFKTAEPTAQYGLLEHPGTVLTIDGTDATVRIDAAGAAQRTQTEVTTVKKPDGKEIVAYTAFFTVLSWLGVRCIQDGVSACLDEKQLKVGFPALDDQTLEKYVKDRGLQSLRVVYFTENSTTGIPDPGAVKGLHDFIDDNMKSAKPPNPAKFHWPFTAGLSMLLFDSKQGYCDDVARARGHKGTAIAFDFSAQTPLDPKDLGFRDWTTLADASPALWPRGSSRSVPGARLDPSDRLWRGIFFRDMPLFLPTPPIVSAEFPFLQRLIDTLNERLILNYGWRDESGPSFVGGLITQNDGERFSPENWKDVLEMFLQSVTIKGAAGSIVTAEVTCLIRLRRFRRKNSTDPIELRGSFGLDLTSGGSPVARIDIRDEAGQPIETDSIPGFKAVALRRVSTDLRTAQFELLLTATPELARALPFLSDTRPQLAILAFNLKGEPSGSLSLALPQEIETNLFGRWTFTAEAMSVSFEGSDDSRIELRIRGRIRLGLEALGAVGAEVVVRRENGALTFDIELQSISGSLSVGSLKLSGGLKWADARNNTGPVQLTNAGSAGKDREMWGTLEVEDPGVIGKNSVSFRAGNEGELSYWIATITAGNAIPIGIGRLKNPSLLVAHNADFEGNLAKTLSDPTGSVFKALRPTGETASWLAKWKPSSSLGTLVAGSGFLHLQDGVAAAPQDGGDPKPELLSSLLFTDRGLIRVDGVALMLGAVTLRFGILIDFEQKRLIAGLQAPTIKMPPENPQYEIQAGYITIGFSFAGADPFFRTSIGWPERVGKDEFERDWSKATKVYIKSMFPINTFWGGYLAELRKDRVVFGFAVRAGFTWSDSVGGGIVKGSAEFGITLGGVFQFALIFGERSQLAISAPARLHRAAFPLPRDRAVAFGAHHETVTAAIDIIEASLLAMGVDVAFSAEIFGDVWGKASVEFLGVTLVAISVRAYARFLVCGTLRQGIQKAKARVGFEVSVTILCVTFHAEASVDMTLVDGVCTLLAPPLLLSPATLPEATI